MGTLASRAAPTRRDADRCWHGAKFPPLQIGRAPKPHVGPACVSQLVAADTFAIRAAPPAIHAAPRLRLIAVGGEHVRQLRRATRSSDGTTLGSAPGTKVATGQTLSLLEAAVPFGADLLFCAKVALDLMVRLAADGGHTGQSHLRALSTCSCIVAKKAALVGPASRSTARRANGQSLSAPQMAPRLTFSLQCASHRNPVATRRTRSDT